MQKIISKLLSGCLLVLMAASMMLAVPMSNAIADDYSNQKVRLGYYTDDPALLDGGSDDDHKSGYGYEYMQTLATISGWTYDYIYGSREEVLQMLADGDVDMVVGIKPNEDLGESVLVSSEDIGVSRNPLYIAVTASRPDLMTEVNMAQSRLENSSSNSGGVIADLNSRYYTLSSETELTADERQWLSDKGSLTIGYVLDNLPISGEEESGVPIGVASVLIESMKEHIDIPIETKPYGDISSMISALHAGEVDAIFPVFYDMWVAETNDLAFSDSIVTDRAMLFYKGEYRDDLTDVVAIAEAGLQQSDIVRARYPDAQIIYCETKEEEFEALERGEANCVIGCLSVLQRFLAENPQYDNCNRALLDMQERFALAVTRDNETLANILNKEISLIPDSTINATMVQYARVDVQYTLMDFVQNNAVPVILFLVVIFAILLFLFISYRIKTNRYNVEQAKSREMLESALGAANAASEAKTTFLSSMSHDIRTPMNGIIGMTSIAEANLDNKEKLKDCLNKISISSKHLLALINDILDMSKIESGEIYLNEEEVDLPTLMENLLTMNKPQADSKKQNFTTHIFNLTHEKVIGDNLRLQQILTNLVSNAIKYTQAGGDISVTLKEIPSEDEKRGHYEFIVKDNGFGMSEEYLPHIFEMFSRDQNKLANSVQGTGLGLAIVHSTVKMMEGDIKVQSKLNEGTTFIVNLYLKLCEVEGGHHEMYAGSKVLVVDDDELACESACLLLDELGLECEYTLSGREAIEMVKQRHSRGDNYDMVFIDWRMPDMDGVSTTRAIRESVGNDMPLVIISAYDWSAIEEEARQAGANAFIGKPLFKSRFMQLFNMLSNKEQKRSDASLQELADNVDFSGLRVLLVEDNELNAEIAVEILSMSGLEFERAHNGQEAVDMVKASVPGYYDYIFMDIQMPIMNGFEAARAIRAMDREDASEVPIFAMTADAFNDDRLEALNAGMDEHLPKPLDFDQVYKVLGDYVARGGKRKSDK